MDVLERCKEVLLSVECTLLGPKSGTEALDDFDELVKTLQRLRLSIATELTITSQLYDFTIQRYANVHIPEENKLDIVYDLDDCLIRSTFKRNRSGTKNDEIVRHGGITGTQISASRDNFTASTYLRRWSRLVLTMFSPFARQYVFTSAPRDYMVNVVSLIEAGYAQDAPVCLGKTPKARFRFFEPKRLSRDDVSATHLLKWGKELKEIVDSGRQNKAILLDDAPKFHIAQPMRGLLVKPFPSR